MSLTILFQLATLFIFVFTRASQRCCPHANWLRRSRYAESAVFGLWAKRLAQTKKTEVETADLSTPPETEVGATAERDIDERYADEEERYVLMKMFKIWSKAVEP